MTNQLKKLRKQRGFTQQQAAKQLGVSQAYVSMLERGQRRPASLAHKLMKIYELPPTVLPFRKARTQPKPDDLAYELASLGYPGFAHLRGKARPVNPAQFLLRALEQSDLEARVAEGLPWVIARYPDLPVDDLLREARARNLQNRLGFVVTLARLATGKNHLQALERELADSKLAKQDTFCRQLSDPERHWLGQNRSEEARQWNLLSDFRPATVRYAAEA